MDLDLDSDLDQLTSLPRVAADPNDEEAPDPGRPQKNGDPHKWGRSKNRPLPTQVSRAHGGSPSLMVLGLHTDVKRFFYFSISFCKSVTDVARVFNSKLHSLKCDLARIVPTDPRRAVC